MVEYELNNPRAGALCVLGRDPGFEEERAGRPFVGAAGDILNECLREAGIRRAEINILNVSRFRPHRNEFRAHSPPQLFGEIAHVRETLRKLRPRVVVALGNEAAWVATREWPDARGRDDAGISRLLHRGNIFGACDIESRRGYVFDSDFGAHVVATVHPAAVARVWTPWRMLLSYDLQRAQELMHVDLRRPVRAVEIVTDERRARIVVDELRSLRLLAADIETRASGELACIGFAGESGRAFVFPARLLPIARRLLECSDVTCVWANGIYDLFVLKHRYGVDVRCRNDDAQVAWHAAYPELAGKDEGSKSFKFTRKSLAFLASMSTYDEWWKGVYETEEEFFIYNGRDCCITFDVWTWVQRHLDAMEAHATYEHERSLMMPCVDMLARGLNVNDALRRERIAALDARFAELHAKLNVAVQPLLETYAGEKRLFENVEGVCECCRHATKKQARCWSCAGFSEAPSKKALVARGGDPSKSKAELEAEMLGPCTKCGAAARRTWLEWNPNSDEQTKIVLYDVLKLPKRTRDGKLRSDEEALKSLLGSVA